MEQLSTAVLLIVFNRPDTTKEVFNAISRAKPQKLYVASDQAREGNIQDAEKVHEVRNLIKNKISWDCDVQTLFHSENQGCREGMTKALDWFFENEELGIILEDDCVPSSSFFRFQQELLEFYKNDQRIMCVSGVNMLETRIKIEHSYYFSEVPLIWGWGSWRRAWKLQSQAIENFLEIKKAGIPLTSHIKANKMWWSQISRNYYKEIDTWDYLWSFANLINNGLTIIPAKNLVKNIGLGHEAATHTKYKDESKIIDHKELNFPIIHPPFVKNNSAYDQIMYKINFNLGGLLQKAILKFQKNR